MLEGQSTLFQLTPQCPGGQATTGRDVLESHRAVAQSRFHGLARAIQDINGVVPQTQRFVQLERQKAHQGLVMPRHRTVEITAREYQSIGGLFEIGA